MDKTHKAWRKSHPQLSVCLDQQHYQKLFRLAEEQRYHSCAKFVRALLVDLLDRMQEGVSPTAAFAAALAQRMVPAEMMAKAQAQTSVQLPVLPGIPTGTLKPYHAPAAPHEEPEDITAEAQHFVAAK
jgi:Arc/MetJ-type ribon-helix-helix transcriptional regulator